MFCSMTEFSGFIPHKCKLDHEIHNLGELCFSYLSGEIVSSFTLKFPKLSLVSNSSRGINFDFDKIYCRFNQLYSKPYLQREFSLSEDIEHTSSNIEYFRILINISYISNFNEKSIVSQLLSALLIPHFKKSPYTSHHHSIT